MILFFVSNLETEELEKGNESDGLLEEKAETIEGVNSRRAEENISKGLIDDHQKKDGHAATPPPPESDERNAKAGNRKVSRREKEKERGARAVLGKWFDEHRASPYPTPTQKVALSRDSGFSVSQVSAWFSNRRNRTGSVRRELPRYFYKRACRNPLAVLRCLYQRALLKTAQRPATQELTQQASLQTQTFPSAPMTRMDNSTCSLFPNTSNFSSNS